MRRARPTQHRYEEAARRARPARRASPRRPRDRADAARTRPPRRAARARHRRPLRRRRSHAPAAGSSPAAGCRGPATRRLEAEPLLAALGARGRRASRRRSRRRPPSRPASSRRRSSGRAASFARWRSTPRAWPARLPGWSGCGERYPYGRELRRPPRGSGRRTGSTICIGLDPRLELLPPALIAGLRPGPAGRARAYERFCTGVIDAVADDVAAVKPQVAFFEALGGPGLTALERVCAHARDADLLVIADAKRGDIGSTAEAYAQAWIYRRDGGPPVADAITVSPYLGARLARAVLRRLPRRRAESSSSPAHRIRAAPTSRRRSWPTAARCGSAPPS